MSTLYLHPESGDFGLTLDDVRRRSGLIIPDTAPDLHLFGYEPYETTPPPTVAWNEDAVEQAPKDGMQQWGRRALTEAEAILRLQDLRAAKRAGVEVQRDRCEQVGCPYVFPNGRRDTLQVRTADDKANWLTLKDTCRDLIAAGAGGAPMPIQVRATSNAQYTLTANQAVVMIGQIRLWGAAVLANSWRLKNEIDKASTKEALDLIDITKGWPS